MKLSKYLIFKVQQQKFAIKTKYVVNVVENVKLITHKVDNNIVNTSFNFNGINIPYVNFHDLLGTHKDHSLHAECVLIAEIIVDGIYEIIGISIDEITEVSEMDDIMSYPYIPYNNNKPFDFRDAIIVYNKEPVVIINTNRIWSKHAHQFNYKTPEMSIN
jgi:chemotaxis signal transduction protein